jgi:hypothetical protein
MTMPATADARLPQSSRNLATQPECRYSLGRAALSRGQGA